MAANVNAFEVYAKIGVDNSGLKKGLSDSKSLLSGFGGMFSSIAGLARSAFSSIGRLAKDFINDSYQTAQEFEQSMAQVAATLGKTVDEVNSDIQTTMINGEEWTGNLREFALEMSGRTKFTATEVGEALNYMALAGYDTAKSMEMLPPVLSLAAAGAMELGRASDVVTDAQTAFGISSERTIQMVDEMAKAASSGNTSVAQLGEAFLVVGGLAKEVGNGMAIAADGTQVETDSLQELETALVAMANAGVKGSEAGTHMRNMLLKLSAPTEEGKKKLQEIGVSALDASGNMRSLNDFFSDMNRALSTMSGGEKMEALADIFNARDITAAQALISAAGNGSWDKIATAILDAEGAAAKMEETQLNTVMGQKKLMESALDIFKITLASNINLPFAGWIKEATGLITDLTDALNNGGFGKMIETLLEEGGQIFEKAMKTGIPKLINKIPKFITSVLPGLISGLLSIGKSVVDAFTGSQFTHNIKAAVKNSIYMIKTFFNENREEMKKTGSALFDLIVDGLKNAASFIGENMLPVLTKIAEFLVDPERGGAIIDAGFGIINNLISGLLSKQSLDQFIEAVPKIIKGLASRISSFLFGSDKTTPGGLFGAVLNIAQKIRDYLSDPKSLEKMRNAAIDALENIGKFLVDNIGLLAKYTVQIGQALAEGIIAAMISDFKNLFGVADESAIMQEYLDPNNRTTETYDQFRNRRLREMGRESSHAVEQQYDIAPTPTYMWTNYEGNISNLPAAARDQLYRATGIGYRGYATGGVFDHESIIRVGENGAEAVMPLENNTEWIDKLAKRLGGGVTIQFGNIYVTGVQNAGREVVSQIDTALRNYQIMQQRGIGGTGWA